MLTQDPEDSGGSHRTEATLHFSLGLVNPHLLIHSFSLAIFLFCLGWPGLGPLLPLSEVKQPLSFLVAGRIFTPNRVAHSREDGPD